MNGAPPTQPGVRSAGHPTPETRERGSGDMLPQASVRDMDTVMRVRDACEAACASVRGERTTGGVADDGVGVGDGLQAGSCAHTWKRKHDCNGTARTTATGRCAHAAAACVQKATVGVKRRASDAGRGRLLGGAGSVCSDSTESNASDSSTTTSNDTSASSSDDGSSTQWEGDPAGTAPDSVCSRDANRRRRRRRGRAETMDELRDRYWRYAFQIDRLIARRGKKWGRVEVIRARQRRCMLHMLQCDPDSQSRALQRVRAYVDGDALREFETGEDSAQVYVHMHPDVRHSY